MKIIVSEGNGASRPCRHGGSSHHFGCLSEQKADGFHNALLPAPLAVLLPIALDQLVPPLDLAHDDLAEDRVSIPSVETQVLSCVQDLTQIFGARIEISESQSPIHRLASIPSSIVSF